jgi:galacturonosyltransferase
MKVLILANKSTGLYNFRGELLKALVVQGHDVFISVPKGDFITEMQQMGCRFIETNISRHGINPFIDLKLLAKYISIIKSVKPDIVFTYTIKPNVYGGMACQLCKVPYVANITGLGTAVENGGTLQKIAIALYKAGLRKAQKVFCQNQANLNFMIQHRVVKKNYALIPGSGVNLERFSPLPYPTEEDGIHFVFISRIMREKGIEQYLDAARRFKVAESGEAANDKSLRAQPSNLKTTFHVCGFCEQQYQQQLEELSNNGTIVYHGVVRNIREILAKTHCTIHPSFYPEGISNVLLESCATARPIITTDRSGCREVIDDGVNGFIVKQCDSADLIEKIEKFLALTFDEKRQMGLVGRMKVEREFDRQIVVDAYLNELEIVK